MNEFIKELEALIEKHNMEGLVEAKLNFFHSTVDIPGVEGSTSGQDKRIPGPVAVATINIKDGSYPLRLIEAIPVNRPITPKLSNGS